MASRRSPADAARPATRAAAQSKPARKPQSSAAAINPQARHELISVAAYLRAQTRGFAAGHEAEDWLFAETEVDALLKARGSSQ
jgi:hypothetical protein